MTLRRSVTWLLFGTVAVLSLPESAAAQPKTFSLESAAGLKLHNVQAEPATHAGKKGLRVTLAAGGSAEAEQLAAIEGLEFGNGVIEAEVAGEPAPGAAESARGFVGIAFRLGADAKTYDAFYLRPTNGRADDQVRRNHSAQYIAHPDWPWFRLRKESPEKYESYVDLVPGVWTKVRIEVRGDKARFFVHGSEHPTLVVNDVKSGANGRGAVALWVGQGTVAHFRNVTVTPEPEKR